MLSESKLAYMLKLQNELNNVVDPDWRTKKYSWCRAIQVEAIEALEYTDWPWWKKKETNIEQLKLELVDIWHFALSYYLDQEGYQDLKNLLFKTVANDIIVDYKEDTSKYLYQQESTYSRYVDYPNNPDIKQCLECIAYSAYSKYFDMNVFNIALAHVGMSWDELYLTYIQKGVLNLFRQNNGYKQGTYVKIWDGQEDNIHLVDIVNSLDVDSATFSDELYSALSHRYNKLVNLE